MYCDYGNTFFMRKSCDKIYRLTELFDMEEDVCQLINGQPEYNGKCRMRGRGGSDNQAAGRQRIPYKENK